MLLQRIRPRQRPSDWEIISTGRVPISELTSDDVIIVAMGPTGVGKSTFIQTLSGDTSAVGHGLESYTSDVSAYRLKCSDGVDIVLVDTPGFDDTHLSDLSVLKIIAKWLKEVGKRDLHVSGFLYLHRISDNRMGGSPRKALEVFQKAAGKHFFSRVTLMTTMWPDPAHMTETEECEKREEELRAEHWGVMIQKGSKVAHFSNTRESAMRIVDDIITAEAEVQWSRIQQELVGQGKTFPTTEAGQQLGAAYEDMVEKQNVFIQRLREEMEKAGPDPDMIRLLQQQLRDELEEWKTSRKEMRKSDSSPKGGWSWRRLFRLP